MTDILKPDPSRVCGVDTDYYLGNWDPNVAWKNGVQFAFIRASQNIWPDVQFAHSWSASKGVMPRGAYCYLTKSISNDGQARQFASMFPNNTYDGELPIVLDLEEDVSVNGSHLGISDAEAFLTALPNYLKGWDGTYIIYTGYSWWKDFGSTNAKYAKIPLWIANPPPYSNPDRQFNPPLLAPFSRIVFIQASFAGDGILYGGTSKAIDLDYYMGTVEQFKTEFRIAVLTTPPVKSPGDNVIGTGKVTYPKSVHIRNAADIYGIDLGLDLQPNQAFNVIARSAPSSSRSPNSPNDSWLQLEDGPWTAEVYAGKVYCSFTPVTIPTVPNIGTTVYSEQAAGSTTAHILKLPLADIDLFVTPATKNNLVMAKTSDQAKANGWDGAINGDGFTYLDTTHVKVVGRAASQGVMYSAETSEQTIYISQTNQITDALSGNIWNAISYPNRLITNGVINPTLDDTLEAAWTIVGLLGSDMYWIATAGIEGSTGITKKAAAVFARSLGLTNAYLMDSGGSTTMVYGGKVVNQPHDTGTSAIVERAVANCLGFKLKAPVVTPPAVTRTHQIDVMSDGSIVIDGKPYAAN